MTAHFIVVDKLLKTLTGNLRSGLKVVLKWFGNNQMMANPGKSPYMFLGKHKPLKIEIERFELESAMSNF